MIQIKTKSRLFISYLISVKLKMGIAARFHPKSEPLKTIKTQILKINYRMLVKIVTNDSASVFVAYL